MKPIIEVMTVNFSLLDMDQIGNKKATLLHMSGGQLPVSKIIRMKEKTWGFSEPWGYYSRSRNTKITH